MTFTAGLFAAAIAGKYGDEAKAIAEELKRMYVVASDLRLLTPTRGPSDA